MKKLLIFALLLCASNVFAQKDTLASGFPFVDNAVVYERVYNVPNIPQGLLYGNARVWFAGTHPDGGKTQLTLRDTVLSRVAGKANYDINVPHKILWSTETLTFTYNFTVQIDCKDNKYRVRIYNILYGQGNTPIEDMVRSLANSKSLTIGTGYTLSKNDLTQRLQILNNVVTDLLADVDKKMKDNNNF